MRSNYNAIRLYYTLVLGDNQTWAVIRLIQKYESRIKLLICKLNQLCVYPDEFQTRVEISEKCFVSNELTIGMISFVF